jgi:hypothetical protein
MADDVIIQAQDTTFQRSGTTNQRKGYFLPAGSAIVYPVPPVSLFQLEQAMLAAIMGQDPACLPGGLTLKNVQEISPEVFNGAAELQQIWQQDPFSDDYEEETQALYERGYEVARSAAISGPSNVRGATARQGFELADLDVTQAINRFREVWQNQVTVAQLVIAAVQAHNTIANSRRGVQLQAQQLQAGTEQGRVVQMLSASEMFSRVRNDGIRGFSADAEFRGVAEMITSESLLGRGQQGAVSTAFGTSYWR